MSRLSAAAALRVGRPALLAPLARHRAVGLAVSGGADSLALMLLAAEWASELAAPPRLIVYSVDHALRPEAAAEAAAVVREAGRLGLAAKALRWSDSKPASGVQAAARAARYRLMGEAMREDGADLLVTAHHRGDQAETVLMRLAHGSGLEGLRGMDGFAEVEGVPVFRPLLDVAPEALRVLVAEAGLQPAVDPSNDDRHYERVRWRQALPQFAELGLDSGALAAFARRAGEADAAIAQWAGAAMAEHVQVDGLGAARLPVDALAGLPRAVAIKLLGRLLALTGGGQRPRALGTLERLHDRMLTEQDFPGATALGTSIRRRGRTLWFSREAGRAAMAAANLGPAQSLLWDRRFRIANRTGSPLQIRMAGDLSRAAAQVLVGQALVAPAAAIRSAPLILGPDGEVLALGTYRLSEAVAVEFSGPVTKYFGNVTAN